MALEWEGISLSHYNRVRSAYKEIVESTGELPFILWDYNSQTLKCT